MWITTNHVYIEKLSGDLFNYAGDIGTVYNTQVGDDFSVIFAHLFYLKNFN